MALKTLACALAGLLLTGAASAQQNTATTLPPDVNPVTLTRLPQLTRADLDDEGKAIYDKIVGDGAVPTTGPVSMSLYSPKVALAIMDPDNPYRYLQIKGRIVETTESGADAHIDSLAKKYMGVDKYPHRKPGEVRVIYKVAPDRVQAMG